MNWDTWNIVQAKVNWENLNWAKEMWKWWGSLPPEKKWIWIRRKKLQDISSKAYNQNSGFTQSEFSRLEKYKEAVDQAIRWNNNSAKQILNNLFQSDRTQKNLAKGGFLSLEWIRDACRRNLNPWEAEDFWQDIMNNRIDWNLPTDDYSLDKSFIDKEYNNLQQTITSAWDISSSRELLEKSTNISDETKEKFDRIFRKEESLRLTI